MLDLRSYLLTGRVAFRKIKMTLRQPGRLSMTALQLRYMVSVAESDPLQRRREGFLLHSPACPAPSGSWKRSRHSDLCPQPGRDLHHGGGHGDPRSCAAGSGAPADPDRPLYSRSVGAAALLRLDATLYFYRQCFRQNGSALWPGTL